MANNDDDDVSGYFRRIGDVANEPIRMLPPIEGFEKMPLVSLEEAIKPLVKQVPNLEQKAEEAKKNSQMPSKHGLNQDEAASIRLYTMEWKPSGQCLYSLLNANLREEDRRVLKDWFSYLRLFIHALDKIPSVSLHLYRGVPLNLSEKYCYGNDVVWWSFSSCSTSPEMAKNFQGKTQAKTLFEIDCYSGKDVKSYSAFPGENEILLIAATQFRITSKTEKDDGLTIINLKEIQPKYPLIKKGQVTKGASTSSYQPKSTASTNHWKDDPKTEPPKPYSPQPKAHQGERNPRIGLIIDKIPSRTRAVFENQPMNQEDMRDVVQRVIVEKRCPKIEIHNAELTAASIKELGEGIRKSTGLVEVDLSGNRLSSEVVSSLVVELLLQETQTVESSTCCGFRTKRQGFSMAKSPLKSNSINLVNENVRKFLAVKEYQSLTRNNAKHILKVKINYGLDKGVYPVGTIETVTNPNRNLGNYFFVFIQELESGSIKVLDLSKNRIDDSGAKHLAALFQSKKTLSELYLNDNLIGDEGLQLIAKSLCSTKVMLQKLYVNNNKRITDRSVDELIAMFKSCQSLNVLWLLQCSFTDTGRQRLVEAAASKKGFYLNIERFSEGQGYQSS